MQIIAFLVFLMLFMLIGFISTKNRKSYDTEYLLANREVSALFTALSAASTKYSGYIFIGLIGYIYTYGLSAIWIVLGFIFGDAIAIITVHKPLRAAAKKTKALSFADLISRWHFSNYRKVRLAIAGVSLLFLMTYAGAQFNAGGKALHAIFGWNYQIGAILGAFFILSYSLKGGLRASIWTDVAQSIVMIGALLILLVSAIQNTGGYSAWLHALAHISPTYLDLGTERFGSISAMILFALGWLFNGIGTIGQPHIMIRLMAMQPSQSSTTAGIYYFSWSAIFLSLVIAVGLSTRLILGDLSNFDAELALPEMAKKLLPEFAIGIILGGVFAAVMSTTDSQILSCSAVLSEDFKIPHKANHKKLLTLAVTLISLGIALFASKNVFNLVVFAWSALATFIAPLVIIHSLGYRPSENLALCMMTTGIITSFFWRFFGFNTAIYECLPGIAIGLFTFIVGQYFNDKKRLTSM